MNNMQALALNQPSLPLPPNDFGMADWAQRNPHATAARFNGWQITGKGLRALTTHCPNLTDISLAFCIALTDADIELLAERYRNLIAIDLGQCQIGDGALLALAHYCIHLQTVRVANCSAVTDNGARALAQCRNLANVSFLGIPGIGDAAIEVLTYNCRNLREVSFGGAHRPRTIDMAPDAPTIISSGITNTGLTHLVNARGTLVSLELMCASNIDEEGLANLLQQCERLTVVNITDCQLITQQVRDVLRNRFPHIAGL